MMDTRFWVEAAILAVLLIQFFAMIILLSKNREDIQKHILQKLAEYDQRLEKNEANIRDEFGKNREETGKTAKESREELASSLKAGEEKLLVAITNFTGLIDNKIKMLLESLETSAKANREELAKNISDFTGLVDNKMKNIQDFLDSGLKFNREELNKSIITFEEKVSKSIAGFSDVLNKELKSVQERVDVSTKENRETVERKLADIQKENSEKLEQMRQTVDEKLHKTLETRLNESFQLVTAQLESVQKGLGEMQTLAAGVGDLKKVLSNVKTRGNLGEIQLGAILEQILSNEQFEKNALIKETSGERVEYVIKLPNKNDKNEPLLLPVDSKFPSEDYLRLIDSYENMANLSPREIEAASKQFENTVKKCAKDIRDKYIDPPRTTDFAFMFVPTEGLFAEIVRRSDLFEVLRRDYKITVVGPTNFAAVLNSLQMGFQTLAIEKRSSDVWKTLGAVKTGFRNFGEALASTKKKLVAATNEIDNVETKSRTIERKLRSVEELPAAEAQALIGGLDAGPDYDDE
ncbi:MAG: DNA recombination protein RmuC [Gracilibacteraceae bacterium]|jgi:DNA recombination protein RmuC|nr:DNA recombination protein RmuC [Gracilibacteraceae bacterium]